MGLENNKVSPDSSESPDSSGSHDSGEGQEFRWKPRTLVRGADSLESAKIAAIIDFGL